MSLPAFDFSTTTDYQGFAQRDLNICLIVFSTVFVATRLYVRAFMTKGLGLDDAATVVAYLLLVVFSGLEIRTVGLGSGAHMYEIPGAFVPPFFAALTTQHLMYFWCVGLMRLAIVAFLLRLARDRIFKILTYATGGVIIVQTIVCFLFRLLECHKLSDLWLPPGSGDCISKDSEAIMMWTHAGVGIAIDVALFCLPIWVVRSKMMNATKAVRVVLIFCVGIFATATGIIRLTIMARTDFSVDTTYKMATVAFWTDLEGHVGLWCACFPALQPLVRQVSFMCGFRSKLDSSNKHGGKYGGAGVSGYGGRSGSHGAASGSSGFHSRPRNKYPHDSSGFGGISDSLSDSNSQRGIVSEAHAGSSLEMDDLNDLKQNGIRRKTEVEIQVEKGF
ncbi:hypothetical protein SUNI508_08254 [Seiridium unicorne]|uniref:Rhodopsin domain-containing protein n=1 Tax=Seiridium unicorne TaxID=138068 RepID=A0ABR2UUH1_9PEZI